MDSSMAPCHTKSDVRARAHGTYPEGVTTIQLSLALDAQSSSSSTTPWTTSMTPLVSSCPQIHQCSPCEWMEGPTTPRARRRRAAASASTPSTGLDGADGLYARATMPASTARSSYVGPSVTCVRATKGVSASGPRKKNGTSDSALSYSAGRKQIHPRCNVDCDEL